MKTSIGLLISFTAALMAPLCTKAEEPRYCNPFVPQDGDTVLLTDEVIVGPEKVFMTFVVPKSIWTSMPEGNIGKDANFLFSFEDAYRRALSFHGDNPPREEPDAKKPISTELISIERIARGSKLKEPIMGRYFYYVQLLKTYAPPGPGLPEQPVNTRIIVLPNGWATYPTFQYMRIKE